eukprot:superscaffoldBa00004419_g18853
MIKYRQTVEEPELGSSSHLGDPGVSFHASTSLPAIGSLLQELLEIVKKAATYRDLPEGVAAELRSLEAPVSTYVPVTKVEGFTASKEAEQETVTGHDHKVASRQLTQGSTLYLVKLHTTMTSKGLHKIGKYKWAEVKKLEK